MALPVPYYVVGNTYRIWLNETGLLVDNAIQDLTGYTVKLSFVRPDGTSFTVTATVDTPATGIAHFDTLTGTVGPTGTATLNLAGQWRRTWNINNGTIDLDSAPINFAVHATP